MSQIFGDIAGLKFEEHGKAELTLHGHQLDVLTTGIGMVNTAFELGRYFAHHTPDLAINAGIAGSFSPEIGPGRVVQVRSENFSELGAEDHEKFLDLENLGFSQFSLGGRPVFNHLENPTTPLAGILHAKGITVNKVHGNEISIAKVKQRLAPQVESMEGAAFFQACLLAGVPFHEIRAISNFVEPRDRSKWQIGAALKALRECVQNLLKEIQP
ncbi:MAG: futalosine hydrolase [Bacteroidia bacterium]|nr:futalosine hydrolase [Bacteroidia bacterium]